MTDDECRTDGCYRTPFDSSGYCGTCLNYMDGTYPPMTDGGQDARVESEDLQEQPFERVEFKYPTGSVFRKLLDTLSDVAVLNTELRYPKSAEKNDEITEKADQLIQDIKELESMIADERDLTEEERLCLRSNPAEVFTRE